MSREKDGKPKSDKTAPSKTLKEKRTEKKAKREEKRRENEIFPPAQRDNTRQKKARFS